MDSNSSERIEGIKRRFEFFEHKGVRYLRHVKAWERNGFPFKCPDCMVPLIGWAIHPVGALVLSCPKCGKTYLWAKSGRTWDRPIHLRYKPLKTV